MSRITYGQFWDALNEANMKMTNTGFYVIEDMAHVNENRDEYTDSAYEQLIKRYREKTLCALNISRLLDDIEPVTDKIHLLLDYTSGGISESVFNARISNLYGDDA